MKLLQAFPLSLAFCVLACADMPKADRGHIEIQVLGGTIQVAPSTQPLVSGNNPAHCGDLVHQSTTAPATRPKTIDFEFGGAHAAIPLEQIRTETWIDVETPSTQRTERGKDGAQRSATTRPEQ